MQRLHWESGALARSGTVSSRLHYNICAGAGMGWGGAVVSLSSLFNFRVGGLCLKRYVIYRQVSHQKGKNHSTSSKY